MRHSKSILDGIDRSKYLNIIILSSFLFFVQLFRNSYHKSVLFRAYIYYDEKIVFVVFIRRLHEEY